MKCPQCKTENEAKEIRCKKCAAVLIPVITKPLICPVCWSQKVTLIGRRRPEIDWFAWNEQKQRYEGYDSYDGFGPSILSLQCADCHYQYPDKLIDQFLLSGPEFQR